MGVHMQASRRRRWKERREEEQLGDVQHGAEAASPVFLDCECTFLYVLTTVTPSLIIQAGPTYKE